MKSRLASQEDRARKRAKPEATAAKGIAASFLSALPAPKHHGGGSGGDEGGAAPLGGGLLGAGAGAGGTGLVRPIVASTHWRPCTLRSA